MKTHSPACFAGINPATGKVNTVAGLDPASVMDALANGEIVVPCTAEACRTLWGEVVDPLTLARMGREGAAA